MGSPLLVLTCTCLLLCLQQLCCASHSATSAVPKLAGARMRDNGIVHNMGGSSLFHRIASALTEPIPTHVAAEDRALLVELHTDVGGNAAQSPLSINARPSGRTAGRNHASPPSKPSAVDSRGCPVNVVCPFKYGKCCSTGDVCCEFECVTIDGQIKCGSTVWSSGFRG